LPTGFNIKAHEEHDIGLNKNSCGRLFLGNEIKIKEKTRGS
jgi:hypothetical protein